MKKKKLTALGYVIILVAILLIAALVFGAFMAFNIFFKKSDDGNNSIGTSVSQSFSQEGDGQNSQRPMTPVENAVKARGYCNTFAGYTAAIIANGGNTTQPGSYFGEAGLDVTINIEDNDDVIIEDFKNGKIDFFFMTVNKMPIVIKELNNAGIDVVIPYLTDTSTGGDGIVATTDYNSIMDLQNAKIAVARNSVSQAIPVYLFNRTNVDTNSLMNNFVQYDSTQDAVNAFLRGEVDAVSTWDMETAANAEESKVLFSTAEGENLVIDALVVNKEYAEKNPDVVKAIVDGTISVVNDMANGVNVAEAYNVIRASVPDFANYDDATLKETLETSRYLGYKKNLEVFETAQNIFKSFCEVWNQLGFDTNPEYVSNLFDNSILQSLADKWSNENINNQNSIIATEGAIENQEALMSKSAQILFKADSADFLPGYDENYVMLDEFVEIAKVFNRMIVVVEGNIFINPGEAASEEGKALSLMRANAVKDYLVANGIDSDRIITRGNGGDNPLPVEIADPNTKEGREMNRRCDIMLYRGESQADENLQN